MTLSRLTLTRRISAALREARRDNCGVGLIVIDIDQFTSLNHTHGTAVGDDVLDEVALRLATTVDPSDTLGRIGGDAFAVICRTGGSATHTREMAQRVQRLFDAPFPTRAGPLPITAAIGIATATESEAIDIDPGAILRHAETASCKAAELGRSQMVTFDERMQVQASQRYRTEQELRAALSAHQLRVHFQPIVNLNTGDTIGAEALARWHHARFGAISPGLFIPVAEETGLIGALSAEVMEKTIRQGAAWNRQRHDTLVSMNLSGRQLSDPQLARRIHELLQTYELDPRRLCLEITESVVMDDVAMSMMILGDLKDMGICLAIDDFGTGYSSLAYLRRLPVDILKVDRSFIQNIHNRDDRKITQAVIELAHTLGMTTIAEGVETTMQLEVLKTLECDMAQGFLLAMPSSADEVDFGCRALDLDETANVVERPPSTKVAAGYPNVQSEWPHPFCDDINHALAALEAPMHVQSRGGPRHSSMPDPTAF